MRNLRQMVNMARSSEEKEEAALPSSVPNQPDYPYGLCIRFTQAELDKLDLDDDVEIGDMLHMVAFAKVTSVSKRELDGKPDVCVEMQITNIAVENESDEYEYDDEA